MQNVRMELILAGQVNYRGLGAGKNTAWVILELVNTSAKVMYQPIERSMDFAVGRVPKGL